MINFTFSLVPSVPIDTTSFPYVQKEAGYTIFCSTGSSARRPGVDSRSLLGCTSGAYGGLLNLGGPGPAPSLLPVAGSCCISGVLHVSPDDATFKATAAAIRTAARETPAPGEGDESNAE